MILVDARRRRPVVRFVAHVVVAGRQIERVFQLRHLLVEPRRRFGVELGNRRDRMH
jgi:hypothetical protein